MTRRRRIVWVAAILVVAALVVPAVAVAAPGSTSVSQGPNSALSWTDVRDSYGVPLSNYMFVTTDGSILNPLETMLALVLQLMFTVWLVIITLAIWVIGFALSFGWLDFFADALLGAANLFAGQVATTIVLITAATLGAFFVSYFVVRGLYAKATMQVVTMLAVAVFGVIFLAHPLAEVLGPDGLLAKGRDLGVSVAAGLHGNSNPDPQNVVATMQASLADNFARKPLQVWNFGHVIDDQCGSAWSSAMTSGDINHAKSSLRACDAAAYAAADEPSFTQFGAGLVLFVCGLILVWFAVRLGLKVIRAALNAVYHGFMTILGFAAGGYVYGPTQTFLIRNLVDTAFAAFGMAAYTIFLGIYVLILGDVFRQARGQVITVLVLGAIVMLIASRQVDNLRGSLESGGEWVASRFATASQAFTGGGGGATSGIGTGSHAMSGLSTLAALTALNTINANPLVAWAAGKTVNPLSPYAQDRRMKELHDFEIAQNRWQLENQQVQAESFRFAVFVGRNAMARLSGSPLAVQHALAYDNMRDHGIQPNVIDKALLHLGMTPDAVSAFRKHQAAVDGSASRKPVDFLGIHRAVTAWEEFENYAYDPSFGPEWDASMLANTEIIIGNAWRHTAELEADGPIDRDGRNFINTVKAHWDSDVALRRHVTDADWNNASRAARQVIGRDAVTDFKNAAQEANIAMRDWGRDDPRTKAKIAAGRQAQRRVKNVLSPDGYRADGWSTN